jgi:Icc-related predicted phosphoesterase
MKISLVFATDFHGHEIHYHRLFKYIKENSIQYLVFGGDLCPGGFSRDQLQLWSKIQHEFLSKILLKNIEDISKRIPSFICFIIMGNDDLRVNLDVLKNIEWRRHLKIIHGQSASIQDWQILGYSFVPPTPFLLKDWEKYENSIKIIEPIAIPPEQGFYSTQFRESTTIEEDLNALKKKISSKRTIFVSHCPPYKTLLDQSRMDQYRYEGLKMDKHLGSVAIRKFIEEIKPQITLHGHIHESETFSGSYADYINRCICINGAFEVDKTDSTKIILIELDNKILFKKVLLSD